MDTAIFGDMPTEGAHPTTITKLDAKAALERLRAGNELFLTSETNTGDTSPDIIKRLFEEGQAPFACVVSCADSRVVPEHIFMTGLGELFCIRVAGNVIGTMELGSCVYAAEHLHTPLVLVLGHTHCGAIEAAMETAQGEAAEEPQTLVPLVSTICDAIGSETDPYRASVANVNAAIRTLLADPAIAHLVETAGLAVRGAIYHTHSGKVDFL
ncbi:MAG: carbonic anhydrase [Coriobacteriales bacterium]|nr:carbonic anhydrase [Coriobacteriales bacterium]